MKIEIVISSLKTRTYVIVDSENNSITFNGEKVEYSSADFTSEILSITKSWKNKMINPRIMDGEKYKVKIIDGIEEKTYEGKNAFPANYGKFKELIRRVANART